MSAAPSPGAGFAQRRWRSPDGLSLALRDYAGADGPARLPVICIHGLTRNARDFEDLAPWIAALGRRVLAVDIRGRGQSDRDPVPERYAVPVYVADIAALLDQAGIARAVFIGTSMGGLITMGLAGLRPGTVAGAVLNDIGPSIDPRGLARIASYAGQRPDIPDWAAAAARARAVNEIAFPHYGPADWDRFARRTFRASADGRPEQDYDPAIAATDAAANAAASVAADPATEAALWGLYNTLAASAPVLVLRGALSDLLSPSTVAAMTAGRPGVRAVTIPGVGHAPMLDEPEARAALAAFLQNLP